MKCDHPQCTGVHGGNSPRSEWYPMAIQRKRVSDARYERSEKGRTRSARYGSTVKGFMNEIRKQAKRRGAK
jgi:hypothetical protein